MAKNEAAFQLILRHFLIFFSDIEPRPKFTIIHDLYKTDHFANEILEEQLENALESQIDHIIIEPRQVGDETSKWIQTSAVS